MGLSLADYRKQIIQLLPHGPAWPIGSEDFAYLVAEAWAAELSRIDARIDDLVNEADPRITSELLADWERACGLPSSCMAGIEQTETERRAALVAQLLSTGGQTLAYFQQLASAITEGNALVTEGRIHTVESAVDYPLYDEAWGYSIHVHANSATNYELLQCVINRVKPAHVLATFSHG